MKKIPVTEQYRDINESPTATPMRSPGEPAPRTGDADAEDPMAGLQADLDRFRAVQRYHLLDGQRKETAGS